MQKLKFIILIALLPFLGCKEKNDAIVKISPQENYKLYINNQADDTQLSGGDFNQRKVDVDKFWGRDTSINLEEIMSDPKFDIIKEKIMPEIFDTLSGGKKDLLMTEYKFLVNSKDNKRKLKFVKLLKDLGMDKHLNFIKSKLRVN
jgi:hypothetical protein